MDIDSGVSAAAATPIESIISQKARLATQLKLEGNGSQLFLTILAQRCLPYELYASNPEKKKDILII